MRSYFILGLWMFAGICLAQKPAAPLTSNLNLSKSNINRLIYPEPLLTAVNARLLLADLEKINPPDEAGLKTWLVANFKRFGIQPDQVKQIVIYSSRSYSDCTICKKNCKGHCVQDPGSDCVCIHKSEPNLRTIDQGKAGNVIYFSLSAVGEKEALDKILNTIQAQKTAAVTN
ncbi:MAG TPA: hypothetical protein PKM27_03440 [Saprospiraceae bacterium]|nr:hypothetical protein [Saprospiraceae bacterium]HNT20539.1 hypothetical protein [Saprospiraceae bacterium]